MGALLDNVSSDGTDHSELLFERICQDIEHQGYSINLNALPANLSDDLYDHLRSGDSQTYASAGIGRATRHGHNKFVRTNEICWIYGDSPAGKAWLQWTSRLQRYINRRLYLGLFSFESHFAHYHPGDFYRRHLDAFKGDTNRVLSVVAYLNSGWAAEEGGELVVYTNSQDNTGIKVTPMMGTLVIFLSEEFPHEVLPATRDRYSIAGWYRVNTSTRQKVDPPL